MLTPGFALREWAAWEKRLGPGTGGSRFAPAAMVRCRVDGKAILLGASVDAGAGDRITIGGSAFLLRDVRRLRDLSGRLNHIEATLA